MTVDANGLRRQVIGEAGLEDEALAALWQTVGERAGSLQRQPSGWLPTLPPARNDLRRAAQLADEARGAFTDLVVLAAGDLALAIRALVTALVPPTAGAEAPTSGTLRVHVVDHLDPDRLAALLLRLDVRRTLFNVVGATGEALATMSHFLIVRERLLRELGAVGYRQHVVVTTRGHEGALRQIVNDEGFRDLVLPNEIEDDATVLTAAALFPVACAGGDATEVLAGASAMAERCRVRNDTVTPLQVLAASHMLGPDGLEVVSSSCGALHELGQWIAQRSARREVQTARSAPASPRRIALFLAVEPTRQDVEIPKAYQDLESIAYLGGQGIAALAAREREATEMAYWKAGRPTVTVTCPAITAHALGQVVALTEATATLGRHGLEAVDRTSAPAGDDARRLAFGHAGRPGYEAERAEMQRFNARREARYVV